MKVPAANLQDMLSYGTLFHFQSLEMRFKSKLPSFQKISVLKRFQERYPNADLSRFTHTDWDDAVYFKSREGGLIQVFDRKMSNNYYYTEEIKKALDHPAVTSSSFAGKDARINLSNFPQELTLNPKPKLPVPAFGHADKPRTFDFSNLEIFVTPKDSFRLKFRDVFTDTKLTHHSGKESRRWLNSPDTNYWPQQLNFAVWCATTGCGISSKMLSEGDIPKTGGELRLPKQVRSFLWSRGICVWYYALMLELPLQSLVSSICSELSHVD